MAHKHDPKLFIQNEINRIFQGQLVVGHKIILNWEESEQGIDTATFTIEELDCESMVQLSKLIDQNENLIIHMAPFIEDDEDGCYANIEVEVALFNDKFPYPWLGAKLE